jgi:putative membrane protein
MKRITWNAAFVAGAIFLATSCSDRRHNENTENNEDSKKVAEKENEAKFDKTDIEDDTDFAVKAADGGMLEVKLGELAQSKGTSPAVKDLGKMMVKDHTKVNEELKALAQQKNISLPAMMSEKCEKKYNDLASKSGHDFDEAYTKAMVKDHKDDFDEFKKEADKGEDPDLKSWAASKLSTLEHHRSMSESAQKAVDDSKKSTGKLN